MKRKNVKRIVCVILSIIMTIASIGFFPVVANASVATATQVAAGANHTLVLLSNGEVWAFGSNERGQLGINNNFATVNSVPVRVHFPVSGPVTYIAAGHNSSYAIIGGQLFAWGCNSLGQLGVNPIAAEPNNRRYSPVAVTGASNVQSVAAGQGHVIARTHNNTILTFGHNYWGQAITGTTVTPIITPNFAHGAGNIGVQRIAAGANHSIAIIANGMMGGAGDNRNLQISTVHSTPPTVTSLDTAMIDFGVTMAAAGNDFTLALLGNSVYAFGFNNPDGRVGRSASSNAAGANRLANHGEPLNQIGTHNIPMRYIAAGHNHALAIPSNGIGVWAWGNNSHSQLGNGTNHSTSAGAGFAPVQVLGLRNDVQITSVVGGGSHSVARAADGSVWAWGNNASGQIGNGSTVSATSAIQIYTPSGAWATAPTFTFDNATRTIHAFSGNVNNVTIPAEIGGIPVERIADNVFHSASLTGTLTIPNTVTHIGANAFRNNQLTSVVFASGGNALTIGAEAFRQNSLTAIEIPARVNSIGNYAFANNVNLATARFLQNDTSLLRTVSIGGMLGNSDIFLSTHHNLRLYRQSGINPAFAVPNYHGRPWFVYGGTNIPSGDNRANFTFTLSGGVYTITGYVGTVPTGGAILFPNTGPSGAVVRTIAGSVFHGVTGTPRNNITSLSFQSPSSVTTIEANAFFGLPNLRSAVIPESVTSIGSTAFAQNPSLAEVHFAHPSGADLRINHIFTSQSIFAGVPAGLRLTRPTDSNAATYVPFVSPAGVTRNWYASDGNIAWWTFTPPTGTGPVTITGFTGPTNLTEITIPATIGGRNVTAIAANTLTTANAPLLQEVTIPASVVSIANTAISGSNLVTVRLLHSDGAAITTLPANAFGAPNARHANFRIVFPVHSTGFTEPTWRTFPAQADIDGVWEFNEWTGQGLIITGFTGSGAGAVVPASIGGRPVRYIGANAFSNNSELREISFPASVVFVSDNAINNVPNLEVLHLRHTNASVFTYFPPAAITNVHADFRIYFPADSEGFSSPIWNTFSAYPQRWLYTIAGGNVTITGFMGDEEVVIIPSTIQGFPVRTIARETFTNNANITSIIVPQTVTRIEQYAVFNCRNLVSVVLEHMNAGYITYFAAYAFVGVASNFRIMFPPDAAGFTTPAWRGYFAEPRTGELTLIYGNFEYTIRRVTLPGTGNISRDEIVITRYLGTTANITIPTAITGIPVAGLGDAVFFQNQFVTQVTLPATLRTIGTNTFAGANNITAINIPAAVTEIGASAFMGATSLARAHFNHADGATVTFGSNTFSNVAENFRITFPGGAVGFGTPTWRGHPASAYGQLPQQPGNQQPGNQQPGNQQPGGNQQSGNQQPQQPRSFPVRTTDTFPGVTGPPIIFRDGVGYVSLRAFAILIESDPATEILFNSPQAGWATVFGTHTDGRRVGIAVTSNDPRVSVTFNGVAHSEFDLATWAGPLSGRSRGQLRTRNEGGNIFLPFRAVSNIFGYDVSMVDSNTVQFSSLPAQ